MVLRYVYCDRFLRRLLGTATQPCPQSSLEYLLQVPWMDIHFEVFREGYQGMFPSLWSYNRRSMYYNSSCVLSALIWTLEGLVLCLVFRGFLFWCGFVWLSLPGEDDSCFFKFVVTTCLCSIPIPPPPFPHVPCLLFLPTLSLQVCCLPSVVLERKWSSLAPDQPGLPSAVAAWGSCS